MLRAASPCSSRISSAAWTRAARRSPWWYVDIDHMIPLISCCRRQHDCPASLLRASSPAFGCRCVELAQGNAPPQAARPRLGGVDGGGRRFLVLDRLFLDPLALGLDAGLARLRDLVHPPRQRARAPRLHDGHLPRPRGRRLGRARARPDALPLLVRVGIAAGAELDAHRRADERELVAEKSLEVALVGVGQLLE